MKLSISLEKRSLKHIVCIISALKELELKYMTENIINASRIIILNHYELILLKRLAGFTAGKNMKLAIDIPHFTAIHASFQIFYDLLPEAQKHIFREDFINNYLMLFNSRGFFKSLKTNTQNNFFN
jgi:hypothetical protein